MAATAVVVTGKVPVVAPAATVTLAGTVDAGLLSVSATTAPPAGAGPLSVTVPAELAPPTKLVGTSASADNVIGTGRTSMATMLPSAFVGEELPTV